jgi:hypothetical protein
MIHPRTAGGLAAPKASAAAAGSATARKARSAHQSIAFRVRADPEPNDLAFGG